MFASSSSSSYSSPRRAKYAQRNSKGMQRSGSIFSAITKIVSAPLSWFASSDGLEDLGKRQRVDPPESDDDEQVGSVRKRMRVDSPPVRQHEQHFAGGYLDPPEVSVRRSQSNVLPRPSYRSRVEATSSRASVLRAPSLNVARTMSMDPPAPQYATYNRDPSAIPLPLDSPMDIARNSASVGPRDLSMRPTTSPFRIRSSLTPQPSPSKPIRREASAPPPLSSLMSRPVFVKPPIDEEFSSKDLRAQKTMSLGSIAEYGRASRSPARELNLNGMTSLHSAPTKLSMSASSSSNIASKTLRELEMYKTPIIPSRYKDTKVIPEFLRQKKVHVPIPMSKKDRKVKPSLGMAEREVDAELAERGEKKPYAGKGSLSKMLAKRRAEEEEERLQEVPEEDEVLEKSTKRDVGVSARIVSESEDDRKYKSRSIAELDPFTKPATSYDRSQPYGRIGRTRTPRTGAHAKSAQLGQRKLGNKFSAAFDEEDSLDDISMEEQASADKGKAPAFEAPPGFSFAGGAPVQHDADKAKEPPISSLPFSFAKPTAPEPVKASHPEASKSEVLEAASTSAFSFAKPAEKLSVTSDGFAIPAAPIKEVPKVAVVPPTPEQSANASAPNFFASPVVKKAETPTAAPSAMPNFFANSAFLQGNKSSASESPAPAMSSSAPVMNSFLPPAPIKDAENPFWDGKMSTTSAPEKPQMSSSKPLPFGGVSKPSALQENRPSTSTIPNFFASSMATQPPTLSTPAEEQRPSSAPSFGSMVASPSTFMPTSASSTPSGFAPLLQPKPAEPSSSADNNVPSPSPSFFTFGASSTNNNKSSTPEPTRPFSAPIISATSSQTSATQPTSPFAFGAPPASSGSNEAPKNPFGGSNASSSGFSFGSAPPGQAEAAKSPFTFGAPPATPPLAADSKPNFGGFGATTGSGFSFGTPSKPAESASISSSSTPFMFGSTSTKQTTPPKTHDDKDMAMEESPTRMDTNGRVESNDKPALSLTFGPPSTSGFGQSNASSSGFSFGSNNSSNIFGSKPAEDESKKGGFSFGGNIPAPQISTTFSFGQKSEGSSTPTTSFGGGAAANPFSQTTTPTSGSTPFSFGSAPAANPFAAPASAPALQQTPSFTFGTPSTAPNNPFNFGSSQPSSPAASVSGLPQSPAATNAPFTFGQPNGAATTTAAASPFGSPASAGGALFNIGAPPPGTPRPVKKLPLRRGGSVKR
ncbi:hypothetical protein SCHPADRAFT_289326 [Schizopora paradoxa]|uniref:Uncharacterized protein n=1 Tax=Schizopora paradoxa TaxID=27342 RepID=A0A0H2RS76_9AGAM|nr:hypothetical protein SCHPADRAFT_289326 [Schizopora paradoxa]